MVNTIKAMIVVLPLLGGVFFMARLAFASLIDPVRIARWGVLFVAATLFAFVIPNFWLALLVVSVAVFAMSRSEPLPAIIFFFLLLMVPPDSVHIPGFAGIGKFLQFSIVFTGVLYLLIPELMSPRARRIAPSHSVADTAVILYALLVGILEFRGTSFTGGLRTLIHESMLLVPVYFVFSRTIKSEEQLRALIVGLTTCLVAFAAIAIVEFGMQWHFYAHMKENWGLSTQFEFFRRAGFVRSYAAQGDPISFGVYLVLGLPFLLALMANGAHKRLSQLAILALAIAILCTLSRTPWLAAIIATGLYFMTGPRSFSRMIQFGMVGLIGFLVLLATPFGGTLVDLIPGLGSDAATGSVAYRQQLAQRGIQVVLDNWLFGVAEPREHPDLEVLRQGQGIVDLVNGYLSIALSYGLTGLGLYLAVQLSALYSVWRSIKRARAASPALAALCQGVFCAHAAFLAAFATMSFSVGHVATIGWLLAGLSVSAARVASVVSSARSAPLAAPDAPIVQQAPLQAPSRGGGRVLPAHLRQYARQSSD